MRYALPAVLAVMLAVVGCTEMGSDRDRVDSALRDHPFFKAFGAVPDNGKQPPSGPCCDGDTTWPIGAWRDVSDPDVDYEIDVQHPYAYVDFHAHWPCTLRVVYTDIPDTSVRDTVVKPAPEFHGDLSFRFEFTGDDWELTDISPCDAEFDSAIGLMDIDSVQVSVRRGGTVIPYPTLDNTGLQPVDPYAYTFRAGDTIDLKLWETHAPSVRFHWTYLHGPPEHDYSPFGYEPDPGYWYGTWTINPVQESDSENWAWFEVIDLYAAMIDPEGPDRSVLWGVPYIVE